MADPEEFVVTPYEVKGKIDYVRLREQFGTQELTPALIDRLRQLAGGQLHPLIERGIYFSHRDLDVILNAVDRRQEFFLYSGRGPSGPLHTAHLMQFDLCAWLQSKFGARMYIQITDDEKIWARPKVGVNEVRHWGRENLIDLLAVGFDLERTHVFFDTQSIRAMYPIAVRIAQKIPYSTVKAVFGFKPSTNIGLVFYTALQTVPCFYPSWEAGRAIPCLIPAGVDQDPHFRVTRDLAESLGYPKPSLLHSQMLPGLLGDRVMSTTGDEKQNAIFLNDPPKAVEKKVSHAFTGGRATVEEQRRLGATPEICSVWAMWRSKFAPEKERFEQITQDCRSGALLCGDCKQMLVTSVNEFLVDHQQRREAVADKVESLIITEPPETADPSGAGPLRPPS